VAVLKRDWLLETKNPEPLYPPPAPPPPFSSPFLSSPPLATSPHARSHETYPFATTRLIPLNCLSQSGCR
jgi:hypothetical protein